MARSERTDTERLDRLEEMGGAALVNDDAGRWAVATTGFATMVTGNELIAWEGTHWVEAAEWKNSIREAIDARIDAMEAEENADR